MIPDRMKRSTAKGEEFLAVGGSDGTTLAGDSTVLALIDTLTKLVNILISNTSTTDATGRQRVIAKRYWEVLPVRYSKPVTYSNLNAYLSTRCGGSRR